jgi:hypothetical protein
MKPIKLSYSAANAFKACPTKYYLSRKYVTTGKKSFFSFGTAVESGVTVLFKGGTIEQAIAEFDRNWETENVDQPARSSPIFDSPEMDYFKSDLDEPLLENHFEILEDWRKELVPDLGENDKNIPKWKVALSNISACKDRGEMLPDNEKKFSNRVHWLSLAERGALMLRTFNDEVMPDFEKLVEVDGKPGCQLKISISNADGDEVMGYVDYVVKFKSREKAVVLDCKTAAAEYVTHNLQTSEQLKTYASALSAKIGSLDVGYLVLVKKLKAGKMSCDVCGHVRPYGSKARNCTKKDCKGSYSKPELKASCQLLIRSLSESELDDQMEDYSNVLTAVKNNINFKNPNSCMQYGQKCEFYDHCWYGKDLKKISNLKSKY